MNSPHYDKNKSAGAATQDIKEDNLPTFSFTEAIRQLDLDRLKQPIENLSEATENVSGITVESTTEYEVLRDIMDEQLEELCFMQIEHTLEQFCGLANESLDVKDELWVPATEASICADYNHLDYNDLNYHDDVDYNNYGIDCFTPYERESLYMQQMKFNSRYSEAPHCGKPVERIDPFEKQATPMLEMVESTLQGFGTQQERDNFEGKRRLCRHFLKGRCNRGNSCDFLHDESIFCTDEQKVFLGGLPAHITDMALRYALKSQGYKVLNKPKVLQGFSPQICLGSVEEAQELIKKGKIVIGGAFVDVRPYEAFAKDNLKMGSEDEIKRSVFLGGLSSNTTGWMIKERLSQLGFVTMNHPVVKSGFSPQVMLETVDQAKRLVGLKTIKINKSAVEIRPYSRYRVKF